MGPSRVCRAETANCARPPTPCVVAECPPLGHDRFLCLCKPEPGFENRYWTKKPGKNPDIDDLPWE